MELLITIATTNIAIQARIWRRCVAGNIGGNLIKGQFRSSLLEQNTHNYSYNAAILKRPRILTPKTGVNKKPQK